METTKPETFSSKNIYKGRIFGVRVDTIREGDINYNREIVVHGGSAVIVPVFADGIGCSGSTVQASGWQVSA